MNVKIWFIINTIFWKSHNGMERISLQRDTSKYFLTCVHAQYEHVTWAWSFLCKIRWNVSHCLAVLRKSVQQGTFPHGWLCVAVATYWKNYVTASMMICQHISIYPDAALAAWPLIRFPVTTSPAEFTTVPHISISGLHCLHWNTHTESQKQRVEKIKTLEKMINIENHKQFCNFNCIESFFPQKSIMQKHEKALEGEIYSTRQTVGFNAARKIIKRCIQ